MIQCAEVIGGGALSTWTAGLGHGIGYERHDEVDECVDMCRCCCEFF